MARERRSWICARDFHRRPRAVVITADNKIFRVRLDKEVRRELAKACRLQRPCITSNDAQAVRGSSGGLAILMAMRRASSRVSTLVAGRALLLTSSSKGYLAR